MAITRRVQRYILREYVSALLTTIAVIIAAILLVDVVEQVRTVGSRTEISIFTAVQLTLYKLPMLLEQMMPFVILIGSIIAYSRLNRQSELPAMRAAGVSAWRFLAPVAFMALILGLFTVMVLNPWGAHLSSRFEQTRASLLKSNPGVTNTSLNGLWLRQGDETGQFVINAREAEQGGLVLTGVKMFEYDRVYSRGQQTDNFEFRRRIEAETARLRDGFWQLENVVENTPGLEPERREALSIPTDLDPERLLDRFASPNTIGFWTLPGFIDQTSRAGLDAARYQMRYHTLLAAPILYVAMALIGAIVCLRLARLGGTSILIAWGALSAMLLYFVTQVSSSLGSAGAAPTMIAALTPPCFALFAALTTIAYQEDG